MMTPDKSSSETWQQVMGGGGGETWSKQAVQNLLGLIISVTKFYKDGLMVPVPCSGGWDILSAQRTFL